MSLDQYRTLGRSGLVVSPLALGTMTFGAERWGSGPAGSRDVFDAYVEAGGNFIDTADIYSGGESETMLGGFIADRSLRDRLVLATKAGLGGKPGNPNSGGNGAKAIHASLEGSLRRLRTDHVDLFWLHAWDTLTPAEEVLDTLGGLIRAGKIRYFGLSNIPVWYLVRMATLASVHRLPGPIALQLEYSLVERAIEREYVPAARELGLGVLPWSPLCGGFLAAKYRPEDMRQQTAPPIEPPATDGAEPGSNGRLSGGNPFGDERFTERHWRLLDVLRDVAGELGHSPAQVALAWTMAQPGISGLILGASRPAQLADNIASLDVRLTDAQTARLADASALELAYPDRVFSPRVTRMMFGGAAVSPWRA